MVEKEERIVHPLVAYVEQCFSRAKEAKVPIERRMIRNLRMFKCEYDEDKLMSIRKIGGSEIFLPLVNIKVRALKSWLTDIFFSSGEPPFALDPTPVPRLPSDIEGRLRASVEEELQGALDNVRKLYRLSGGQIDLNRIIVSLKEAAEDAQKKIQDRVVEYARQLADKEKKRIDDQFVEGGFYDALSECLWDLGIFPSVFLKSCVPRRVKKFNPKREVEYQLIPTFNRVSPFDIYPSPYVSDFSDYVVEVLHLTPYDLLEMIGVPTYVEDAIERIVGLYGDVGYSINENFRSQRASLEGKSQIFSSLIDVLEFWGTVKGDLLKDFIDVDPDFYYDVVIWVCDGLILRAALNPDPFGIKPYHKGSFVSVPNSFWGLSLADILCPLQEGVNALARSIINNAVLSSGPMVERNIDRIPSDEEKIVLPWKVFDATGIGYDSSPAYRFYQPAVTANAVAQVMDYFMKMADELSGVPAYAHGNITVGGGAGRTAAGLSMLMANANRGIKEVVRNIDKGLIEPVVKRQYYFNLINFYGEDEEVPDLEIKAKGSVFLMEKLSHVQRLLELLQLTNNPIDMQLVGLEGRKYLLDKVFQNFGVEVPKPTELDELVASLKQQLLQQVNSYANPQVGIKKEQSSTSNTLQDITDQAQGFRKEMLSYGGQ